MAMPGQDVIDRIELAIYQLLQDCNEACSGARNAWIFFMALLAYFLVALGSVTHRDLLLNTDIALPLLQVSIPLKSFFVFAPLVLVLVHFGILQQHVVLARKLKELHERLSRYEGNGFFRTHRFRTQVHPYSFAQAIAGPSRSPLLAGFFYALNWVTLGALPLVLLLNFQVTFLPYHDWSVTALHRFFLVLDFLVVLVLGVFMRYPEYSFWHGLKSNVLNSFGNFIGTLGVWVVALLFSFTVATLPDETMDRFMRSLWPVKVDGAVERPAAQRTVFAPTAFLFEGTVDAVSGTASSPFTRNLVITDADVVRDRDVSEGETSISLRRRDLRYARFDRSDLHQADFSGADLTGANLQRANLQKAQLQAAILTDANMQRAIMVAVDMPGADLTGADLRRAYIQGADLTGAKLVGTDIRRTRLLVPNNVDSAVIDGVVVCADDQSEIQQAAKSPRVETCPPK